jgi:hypothetical protein
MYIRGFFITAALILFCAASSAAQSVKLEFRDGRVSLSAQNAPLRTILSEWARLGGTKIVNGDRVPGGLVTLELNAVPERQALDTLLRNATGYMAGPRQDGQGGPSSYASILILPTSSGLARPATAPPPAAPPQGPLRFTRPIPQIVPPAALPPDLPGDEDEPAADVPPEEDINEAQPPERGLQRFGPGGTPRPFVPGTPVAPNDDTAAPAQPPTTTPTNPFGTFGSTQPGTITPVPQQPQQRPRNVDPEP